MALFVSKRAVLPRSDHCDGQRFFNPGPRVPQRGWRTFLRRRLQGTERAAWPRHVENRPYPPPPAQVDPGSVAITFINHATALIRLPGLTVLTDPIFSRRCSPVSWAGPARVRLPGIALADLPRPDLLLLSHNHYDHMDLPSLRWLHQHHAPPVVTLLGNARILARAGIQATELDWWETTIIGPVQVSATPARHFSARTPFDRNRALWGGFMLRADAGGRAGTGQVLFAGDSGDGPHWQEIRDRLGPPDVALLPIGAYLPREIMAPVHMDPAEAVQAHRTLGARHSVGTHFGTFQLTDEAIDAPIRALEAARTAAGLTADTFVALKFGETRRFQLGT